MNGLKFVFKTLIFAFFLHSTLVKAEDSKYQEPVNIGIYLGGNLNMHSPNYSLLVPTSLDTAKYSTSKNSLGLNVGLIFNHPLSSSITLSGRIGYHNLSADLTSSYKYSQNLTSINDTTANQTLKASISYLEISPMFKFYNLIPVDKLYLLGGIELGIPLSKTFTLEDSDSKIKTSNTVVTPRKFSGDNTITDAGIRFALGIGAGYTYKLSERMLLTPEVSFRMPFTKVSSNANFTTWDIPQIRFGVSLTYAFKNDERPMSEDKFDKEAKINSVDVYGINNDGTHYPVDKIKVEEMKYSELFPIVPYVFCEQNEPQPANYYKFASSTAKAGDFEPTKLEPDAVKISTSTLDIIATRMVKNPNANLTITGTNDNTIEKGNKELSDKRAEYAKNYIVVNYGISPDRIKLVSQNLPSKPSAQKDKDGIAENRRIEFSSDNTEILEPILIEKDKQTISTPSLVGFDCKIDNIDSNFVWRLEIAQADKTIKFFSGKGQPESTHWAISPNDISSTEIPLDYTLTVISPLGKVKTKVGKIPIEFFSISHRNSNDAPDKTISKFSLMVFDFDSPNISESDKRIIDKNIVPTIQFNSTVQIIGYTDRIGEAGYNQKLSLERATSVEKYLKEKFKNVKFEVSGLGESVKVFDNDLPIGRQLSRTVQVNVITPKQ